MQRTSKAGRKLLPMPWPVSKTFPLFSSTSPCQPCPSGHLLSIHKCHLNSPPLVAQQNTSVHLPLVLPYFVSQCTNIKKWSVPQPASDSLQKSMKHSHLTGTRGPPCRDELPLPCTATKVGSGDAQFYFPVMALTSEDSFLIWFSSSASRLRPGPLLVSITLHEQRFCLSHLWALEPRCWLSACPRCVPRHLHKEAEAAQTAG